jgi:hypothetical protein
LHSLYRVICDLVGAGRAGSLLLPAPLLFSSMPGLGALTTRWWLAWCLHLPLKRLQAQNLYLFHD